MPSHCFPDQPANDVEISLLWLSTDWLQLDMVHLLVRKAGTTARLLLKRAGLRLPTSVFGQAGSQV